MELAVLIPVFNERHWLPLAIARFDQTPPPAGVRRRLILVDDGSTDGSADLVRSLGEREDTTGLTHAQNKGKGAALRTALAAALQPGHPWGPPDVILIHDADLEYDPADHPALLEPIMTGKADAVIGSRFLGPSHRVLYYWHYLANTVITHLCNAATNLNLTDIECCSKAFTREVASRLTIEEMRFGVEPELVAKLAAMRIPSDASGARIEAPPSLPVPLRRLRVYEVAISYAGRTYDEGKKIRPVDGLRALWCILKYGVLKIATRPSSASQ
ncbi:MAG: glycosyltransferase family 2 protein [Planctomycetota bacterium]|nr:glycosyltransferase family 2 protein [Planctomycetota bacterium]